MSYRRALEALERRQETRVELGLTRVRRHLRRLGDPQDKVPAFHVAGTNGKGSTCAMLASVLRAAGYKVGLYTSPHLLDVRERIVVDGHAISKQRFATLAKPALDPALTYFEVLTSIAFQHFAASKCDVAVLETGLGGRLDATNVVRRPLAAIVTSIDFDHQAWLGDTLNAIAREKAGIFKAGRPSVSRDLPALRRASPRGVRVLVRAPWRRVSTDWRRGVQKLRAPSGRTYALSLLGDRQGWNAALAKAAVDASGLAVPESAWAKGLASVRWPARFQALRMKGGRTLVVDGAHNPEAARALAAAWAASPWSKRPARWILGFLRDKDVRAILKPLARSLRDVVLVRPPSPRALEPLELAALVKRAAPRARLTLERDPSAAIRAWRGDRRAPKTAVCAGSLYLAGAALRAAGARA